MPSAPPGPYRGGVEDDAPREQVDPRLVDAVLATGMTLAVALVIAADLQRTGRGGATAYGFAVGFGLLVLARRRWPRAVLGLTVLGIFGYYALDLPPIGIALPAVAALYSAAEAGRTRWAVGAAAVLVATSGYFLVWEGRPADYLVGYEFVTNIALAAASVALGASVRLRRETREQQQRLRRLEAVAQARQAAERAQAERLQVARELHDSLGHSLAVVSLHAGVAQESVGRDDAAVTRALEQVRAAGSETLRELRATVRLLREQPVPVAPGPETPGDVGLAGVPALAAAAEAAGLVVRMRIDVLTTSLAPEVDAAAYRIVQEALTNVLRHSRSPQAEVRAQVSGDRVQLTVSDPGPAAHPFEDGEDRDDGGHGLRGMAERAALVGGVFRAHPRGAGFVVHAELPVRRA